MRKKKLDVALVTCLSLQGCDQPKVGLDYLRVMSQHGRFCDSVVASLQLPAALGPETPRSLQQQLGKTTLPNLLHGMKAMQEVFSFSS